MKDGLQYFTDTNLTVIGLLIFFIWFVIAAFRTYKMTSEKHVQYMSQIPLADEEALR